MDIKNFRIAAFALMGVIIASCSTRLDTPDVPDMPQVNNSAGNSNNKAKEQFQASFNVSVTREGENIPDEAITKASRRSAGTKAGGADSGDMLATMDTSLPFGIIGIDQESNSLLVNNTAVYSKNGTYTGVFDAGLLDIPTKVTFSAYYPYVKSVTYERDYEGYSIPYSTTDTEAGPLVSKTVQRAVDQLNMTPLEFQHITNDIGFKICDVTEDPQLQGLIHLRKVTATNVASAGVFVNDLVLSEGIWHRQGYYRNVVVFEGDAVLGVGMENEKFIGSDKLVDRMADSYRYYAIPDEIMMGKQCVEVIYDVDSFTIEGYTYKALTDQKAQYMLYGVLPDNQMVYGKQYTFHLGLDTGQIYKQIAFSATVNEWETKIYENNDDF